MLTIFNMSTSQSTTIQLRIDSHTKKQAQAIFKKLGTDVSSALKLFLAQVIRTKSIPFRLKTINGYTPEYEQELIDEWKRMKAGDEVRFSSIEALMADSSQEPMTYSTLDTFSSSLMHERSAII
jgi:DNA-damage-inducible protein J